jgi:hypothetical protein
MMETSGVADLRHAFVALDRTTGLWAADLGAIAQVANALM